VRGGEIGREKAREKESDREGREGEKRKQVRAGETSTNVNKQGGCGEQCIQRQHRYTEGNRGGQRRTNTK
jgi:hypothetical protein